MGSRCGKVAADEAIGLRATERAAAAVSLTAGQIATFAEQGHLRLPEVFPPEVALQMQANMWAELRSEFGIDRDDRGTWRQPPHSLRRSKWDPLQHGIVTPVLRGALDALLGPGRWRVPSNWGVVLVTFPDRGGGCCAASAPGYRRPTGGAGTSTSGDVSCSSMGGSLRCPAPACSRRTGARTSCVRPTSRVSPCA